VEWRTDVQALALQSPGGLLQTFRRSLADPRVALATWVEGTDPCGAAGRWAGVVCDPETGAVAGLALQDLGLAGPLPAELALLESSLTQLSLDGNSLTGKPGGPSNSRLSDPGLGRANGFTVSVLAWCALLSIE
jgi:hypothetical protein